MDRNIVFNSLENILKGLMPDKNWIIKRNDNNIEIYENYKDIDNFVIKDNVNYFEVSVPVKWTSDESYVSCFNKTRKTEDIINYLFRQVYSYYNVK